MEMPERAEILTWLHIGDLHITAAGQENHRSLLRIVDLLQALDPGSIDFAVLPGDNADDGTAEQFALVRDAVDRLPMPLHVLPGDHDVKPGTLDAFHGVLGADRLPKSVSVRGCRCLFLDVVSAGSGGPDFRLDQRQLDWAARQIAQAETVGETVVVFMHTYPADLREGAEPVRALLARRHVLCVDMGHTHYNELANDGRTIFMATRSTGQIEEGPVGFSFAAVDGGVVSWRFRPLDDPWPFVMITSPADYRLIIDPHSPDQVIRGTLRIAAKVWGMSAARRVHASIDGGPAFALACDGRSTALWGMVADENLTDGKHELTVRAEGEPAEAASDTVSFLVSHDGSFERPSTFGDGSDRDAVGMWPDKHLLGTQLGPNRNGRHW
jgi:Icc protein